MKKVKFILRYFRYLLTAKGKHFAQAPFLYSFITKVLNAKKEDKNCRTIEALRKELCISKQIIQITDFGAGSSINNSKKRRVKDVAQNSAKNAKFGQLLYRICRKFKPKNIIELGTSLGISSCYLAKANPNAQVFTFEGCSETAAIANSNFKKLDIENISITLGDFNNTLTSKLEEVDGVDLVFIDGNHQENPTIAYFEEILKFTNNESIFIFDDIHWSCGMENAWNYIKSHQRTTLSIDLFFVGIVFVKTELSKEHFTIRF